MSLRLLREKVKEFQARRAAIATIWRPVRIFFSILAGLWAIFVFIRNNGTLSVPVIAFALLSAIILMTVPLQTTRLFILRVFALSVDFLILAIMTIVLLELLFLLHVFSPFSPVIMTWLWFFYFVCFDHLFQGTPGKYLFGLRVLSVRKGTLNPLASFIRTFLSIPLPILLASYLTQFVDTESRLKFFVVLTTRDLVLSLVPISILFFGGNQGIVDKILGSVVLQPRTRTGESPSLRGPKTWIAYPLTAIVFAMASTAFAYFGLGPMIFPGHITPPPEKSIYSWEIDDPSAIEDLWRFLPQGLNDPASQIAYIRLVGKNRNPFRADETDFVARLDYRHQFESASRVRVVQIFLLPPSSTAVKAQLLNNALRLAQEGTPLDKRPFFIVLQFLSEMDFGPLRVVSTEFVLLCLMRSGDATVDFYTDLNPSESIGVNSGIDLVRMLLLCDMEGVEWSKYRMEY